MDGGDGEEIGIKVKKGTWSSQEDSLLVNYISIHGEGRWNYVARDSGLRRTGKSCRLRWKNYLQPNVRRGNFTVEEKLCIVELHCIFGNRWSKIAEFLPGRTDNEIKNYWRSRVLKQGKQLKYDTNSDELREFVHNIWINSETVPTNSCNYNYHHLGNDLTMISDKIEPTGPEETLEMDNWPNLYCSSLSSEAHQLAATKINSDNNPTPSELDDFGQQYYCGGPNNPYNGYGLQGSDSPAYLFNYEELSNILMIMNDN